MNPSALESVREFSPYYSGVGMAPSPQRMMTKSPRTMSPSPFSGNESLEEAKAICKSKRKVFRRGFTRADGTIVEPDCVRKSGKGKSPKKSARKSTKRSPKKSCPSGKVYRKSYVSASGKRVAAKCVKKGGPKSSGRKSTKKSPKKSCPSGKIYRKSYVSASGKRVAAKCVKKGGPKSSGRKTRKSPKKTRKSPRKARKSPMKARKSPRKARKSPMKARKSPKQKLPEVVCEGGVCRLVR